MSGNTQLPPLVIGADIGHGFTKIACDIGKGPNTKAIPSVVSLAEDDTSLISQHDLNASMVECNGERFFIGHLATCVDDSRQLKNRDDSDVGHGPVWNALMRGALAMSMAAYFQEYKAWPQDIFIASGLPVRFYDSETARNTLIESIEGIEPFSMGTIHYPVPTGRIRAFCLPQSYASFLNELFDDEGNVREDTPLTEAEVIGIMDIGHRTTDLAFIQMQGNRYNYIPSRKGFKEIGMRDVLRHLIDDIFKQYSLNVPESRASRMLRFAKNSCILRVGGRDDIDVSDLARNALNSVARRVCDSVSFGWKLEEIDVLLLIGGAGERMHDAIVECGGDSFSRLVLCRDSFFANAKGYAKYAAIEAEGMTAANEDAPRKAA